MDKLCISKQLASLMRGRGVSQSGLSRGCGVPQPTINRILNEKTREPRRDSVVRIAAFFNVPPESLYKELPGRTEELDLGSQLHRQMTALRPDHRRKVLAKLVKDFG
ncbi:MAG: helix-turn-helix domain-containing protein [Porticoccaceae bacterium]